jgi:hypothetical protein
MSKQRDDGLKIDLLQFIDLSGRPNLKKEPDDTEEEVMAGEAWLAREGDRIRQAIAVARPRLLGNRTPMSAPIESAISKALDRDDLFSIWAALVAIAEGPDRPAPLLGLTEDGSMVRYRDGGKIEIFTRDMLKQRLLRQQKAKKQ